MRVPATDNHDLTLSPTLKQGHSEAEWNFFRPIITQMYLEQGLKLEDVRKELEEGFGFQASRKMYNLRIRRWGIKKNYLSTEKQDVADELAANLATGVFRTPTINGRAVTRMDKVERYLRTRRRQSARISSQKSASMSCTPSGSETDPMNEVDLETKDQSVQLILPNDQYQDFQFWLQSLLPTNSVPHSLGFCRYETVLHIWGKGMRVWIMESQTFQHLSNSAFNSEQTYQMTNKWYQEAISNLTHARRSLELGSTSDAIVSLNTFCADFATILKTRYWPFLNQLIAETVFCLWRGFSEWRTYIFSFFVRMASAILGKDNDITQLFKLLADGDWIDNISASVMRLGIDVLDQNKETYVDHAYEIIRDAINVFMLNGDIQAAEYHALQHVNKAQTEFGYNHWATHRALRVLAFVHKRDDKLVQSHEILLKILQSDDLGLDSPNGSTTETSTDILIFLGDVCGRLGLFDECTKHLTRFLEIVPCLPDTATKEWQYRALCLLPESLARGGRRQDADTLLLVADTVAGRRARAWAKVRLQFWPKSYQHLEDLSLLDLNETDAN